MISAHGRRADYSLRARVIGCVDSGADRTFLPLAVARRLGLSSRELVRDALGAIGVEGIGFPTWSSNVPLEGRVVADMGHGPAPWGPLFAVNPAFSEKEPVLLGRADFFQAFVVTFQENASAPVFHLDY